MNEKKNKLPFGCEQGSRTAQPQVQAVFDREKSRAATKKWKSRGDDVKEKGQANHS